MAEFSVIDLDTSNRQAVFVRGITTETTNRVRKLALKTAQRGLERVGCTDIDCEWNSHPELPGILYVTGAKSERSARA